MMNHNDIQIRPKHYKQIIKGNRNYLYILIPIICMFIILLHAINSGHYVNYYPTNGTFQNYNPVRRLLDGQIPYKDFQDYLGLGHLFTGSLFTILFGGNYRASLIAFTFLTLGSFTLMVYVTSKAVFSDKKPAAVITNIVIIILLLIEPFVTDSTIPVPQDIQKSLAQAINVGNSARFVRGLILPLSCVFIYFEKRIISQKSIKTKKILDPILIGFIAGISFIWSNDYGIGCWLCILLMYLIEDFSENKKIHMSVLRTFLVLICSLLTIIMVIEILTFGNLIKWFKALFGTGGFQRWYYNSRSKSYYFWDIDTSFSSVFQTGLCIYYLVCLFCKNNNALANREKHQTLAYLNMTSICVVQEYKLLSGGDCKEVAISILLLTVFTEVAELLFINLREIKDESALIALSIILSMAWLIPTVKKEIIFSYLSKPDGVYIEKLGGNLTSFGDDLLRTDHFLNGDDFFSTFSSAQEVVSGIWQPSGVDYIIHALGDRQRNEYLGAFQNKNFKYTATIKESFTDWEFWDQRANWFLFREIFENWHPVYANSYELYWEKNSVGEKNSISNNISIKFFAIDETNVKIIVQSDPEINGTADCYIDYKIRSRGNKSSLFNFNKMLTVKNSGAIYAEEGSYYDSNNLRPISKEYIPIPVVNGYGEVILTANPQRSVYLEVNDVKCKKIFTVSYDYLEILQVHDDQNPSLLYIDNNYKNQDIIANIREIEYEGINYPVIDTQENASRIIITIDGHPNQWEKNMVKVIR